MEGIDGMRGIGGMKFSFFVWQVQKNTGHTGQPGHTDQIESKGWTFGGMAVHKDFGVKNGVWGENGPGKGFLG